MSRHNNLSIGVSFPMDVLIFRYTIRIRVDIPNLSAIIFTQPINNYKDIEYFRMNRIK